MYQLLMQPPAGVDPGEENGKTGTTNCQQAGYSVNNEVRMGFSFNSEHSDITGEFLTVRSAAEISGYNQQYIQRLLRNRVF